MRDHYDFSKARKNPYARKLKRMVTMRLDDEVLAYFKGLSGKVDVPYQTLINLYLKDCVSSARTLSVTWK